MSKRPRRSHSPGFKARGSVYALPTPLRMAKGFVHLEALVDWFSRKVLAWRVSITLEADFCVEALEEALARFGKPEIFNTDQDSQSTSMAFTDVLLREKIAISMDGRAAWRDNAVVERLWRSVKYEEVYLRAYGAISEARASISQYLSTMADGRIRALPPGRRIRLYCDSLPVKMAAWTWQPIRGVIPARPRPPCMTPRIGKSRKQPADDPLNRCQSLFGQTDPPLYRPCRDHGRGPGSAPRSPCFEGMRGRSDAGKPSAEKSLIADGGDEE